MTIFGIASITKHSEVLGLRLTVLSTVTNAIIMTGGPVNCTIYIIMYYIRRHYRDVYLGMSLVQHGGSYLMY